VLKAMGFDGDIGTIDLDWAAGTVRTDPAQKAELKAKGRIEVQSSHLPMCFFDDTACGQGYPSVPDRYVLQHCPFNQDLNRYMLTVRGLPNQPVRVTWDDRSLFFTREQLEAGINLAAEFPQNPFCPTMHALDAAVFHKQVFERSLFAILNVPVWDKHFEGSKPEVRHKMLSQSLDEFSLWAGKEFADDRAFLDECQSIRTRALRDSASITPEELSRVRRILFQRDRQLQDKVRAIVKPVRHVITVEPVS
jgi:hypothetical protein